MCTCTYPHTDSGVPRGAKGAIRPGRHSEGGGKKGKKEKRREKGKDRKKKKKEKKEKKKIWEKHVITVKLNWNILATAPALCTYKV